MLISKIKVSLVSKPALLQMDITGWQHYAGQVYSDFILAFNVKSRFQRIATSDVYFSNITEKVNLVSGFWKIGNLLKFFTFTRIWKDTMIFDYSKIAISQLWKCNRPLNRTFEKFWLWHYFKACLRLSFILPLKDLLFYCYSVHVIPWFAASKQIKCYMVMQLLLSGATACCSVHVITWWFASYKLMISLLPFLSLLLFPFS